MAAEFGTGFKELQDDRERLLGIGVIGVVLQNGFQVWRCQTLPGSSTQKMYIPILAAGSSLSSSLATPRE